MIWVGNVNVDSRVVWGTNEPVAPSWIVLAGPPVTVDCTGDVSAGAETVLVVLGMLLADGIAAATVSLAAKEVATAAAGLTV
jgi:hypothetical protein